MRPPSFIWFSWGADAACLLVSVAAVQSAAPGAALHVRYDPDAPLPDDTIRQLLQIGVTVRPSQGPHGGNLNGADHVQRQLSEMEHAAGGGWIVKLDSDTLVRSLDWLAPALNPANQITAVGFKAAKVPWCGPCYALSAGLPRPLREAFADLLRQPVLAHETLRLPPNYPEDATLFRLLQHTRAARVLRWPAAPTGPFFSGFQYPPDCTLTAIQTHLESPSAPPFTSVTTFGNLSQIPPSAGKPHQIAAQTMAAALAL